MFERLKEFIGSAQIASLTVNGLGYKVTVKRMQEFFGVEQNGILYGQNKSLYKYYCAWKAVSFGTGGCEVVWKLQKWLGFVKRSGVWDKNTSVALQKKLIAEGYLAKGEDDGIFYKKSMRAWQTYLNEHDRAYPKPQPAPTPTPPQPTPSGSTYAGAYPLVNRAKLIVDMAIKLAWSKGTAERVYRYPSGSATKIFQNALNSAYPEHRQWGAAPSVGASCDVFVGTVVRSVGIDKNFPRGLQEQFEYSPKWADRLTYSNIAPISKVQYGDLVMFEYDNGAHIIVLGKDDYYEANYQTYFGHTNSSFSRIRNRQNKTVILRPKNYLEYKDSGSEVLKLQKYLNWYFRSKVVEENSYFGTEVRRYVRQMQTDFFGAKEADGCVDEKTLAKMREVVR